MIVRDKLQIKRAVEHCSLSKSLAFGRTVTERISAEDRSLSKHSQGEYPDNTYMSKYDFVQSR